MKFNCYQLSKGYQTKNGLIHALEDVTFGITEHEFVCIVGPSGCGKTTLLKLFAGLIEPTSGEIIIEDESDDSKLRSAMVFQEHALYPWMTVHENVSFGWEARGVPRRECRKLAREFIEMVGLNAFIDNYPHELSVGMSQRVNIARAFFANPRMLLMDEPFGSLDAQIRLLLQEELLRIWKDHRNSIVYVTHDIEEAVLLGDRVIVMSGRPGRILTDIPIPLERPRNLSPDDNPVVKEIRWQIWKMLEKEVRQSLSSQV